MLITVAVCCGNVLNLIGRRTINIPEIIFGVHASSVLTVTYATVLKFRGPLNALINSVAHNLFVCTGMSFTAFILIVILQAAVQNLVTKVTTVLDNLIVTPDAAELVSIVDLSFDVVNLDR